MLDRISEGLEFGRQHFIIVVAEVAGSAVDLAGIIGARTGIETKATVLGHVQRGRQPHGPMSASSPARMGHRAVQLLMDGKSGRVVVRQRGIIEDVAIEEALAMTKGIDEAFTKWPATYRCKRK